MHFLVYVTKCKLVLLVSGHRTISWEMRCWGKGEGLGQKARRERRRCTSVLKNHIPLVRVQASFILKGKRMAVSFKLLGFRSFVFTAVHVGLVTIFLWTSNKINVIFCSATSYLYMNEKYYTLKSKAWEAEHSA